MDSHTVKNLCDVCAITGAAFSYLFNNAPQIAAVLSALWLLLRIFEWGIHAYRGFPTKDRDDQ